MRKWRGDVARRPVPLLELSLAAVAGSSNNRAGAAIVGGSTGARFLGGSCGPPSIDGVIAGECRAGLNGKRKQSATGRTRAGRPASARSGWSA